MNPLTLLAASACSGVALAQWGPILGASRASGAAPVTFSDNFTRADENPLSDGGAWVSITGFSVCYLVSNLAKSFSGNGMMYVGTPSYTSSTDQKATITLSSTSSVGAAVRMTGAGNGYLLFVSSSTQLQFYKIVSASPSQIGSNIAVSALSAGNTVSLGIVGTTLTAYVNGVSQGTTTDATYASGSPGIWSSGSSNNIAAFSSTSL